jgi:hypothetical protein
MADTTINEAWDDVAAIRKGPLSPALAKVISHLLRFHGARIEYLPLTDQPYADYCSTRSSDLPKWTPVAPTRRGLLARALRRHLTHPRTR